MATSIPRTAPIRFGIVVLAMGGALLGCSSRAEEGGAEIPKVEARMVYYAMPG